MEHDNPQRARGELPRVHDLTRTQPNTQARILNNNRIPRGK